MRPVCGGRRCGISWGEEIDGDSKGNCQDAGIGITPLKVRGGLHGASVTLNGVRSLVGLGETLPKGARARARIRVEYPHTEIAFNGEVRFAAAGPPALSGWTTTTQNGRF